MYKCISLLIKYFLVIIDAGILISNSVLKAMRENLEWCVANAVSDDHSENIGRCVYHSTNLECQEEVQVFFFYSRINRRTLKVLTLK